MMARKSCNNNLDLALKKITKVMKNHILKSFKEDAGKASEGLDPLDAVVMQLSLR